MKTEKKRASYPRLNHDRQLKCWDKIHIENMKIIREMYYKTLKWKTYYITHGDCLDWINKDWNSLWQLWSITFWLLLKIENIWNKNVFNHPYLSIAERLEEWIKKVRMPDYKINKKIKNFSKNINFYWIIIWHFHVTRHYKITRLFQHLRSTKKLPRRNRRFKMKFGISQILIQHFISIYYKKSCKIK